MIHRRRLVKPDGRALVLYAGQPLPDDLVAPQPSGPPVVATPHLRWHPFRAEWVDYAGHRQERTFLPPPDWDPLAPTAPGGEPTELPAGPWQVAVFENRFPSLAPRPPAAPPGIVATRPGHGICEVVVYTQERQGGLGDLPLHQIELLVHVWAERTAELGARDGIEYVMPFENRGVEVGATLHHPHGQIYAYPLVPPIPARELEQQRAHLERHGRGLLEQHIEAELQDGRRMLYEGESMVAFVPAFARYPYEVWIAPRAARPDLPSLDARERADLARALKTVVLRFDGLFGSPFPYVMVFHQAPTDGAAHPEAHLHAEFYPPYRSRGRLKYLAGTEIGAGLFTNDALPEAKAAELRAVSVSLEEPAR
jgi:UDPglucose--hexose-1-phosphate uridylyltransferase